jgi:hypothetical protein
MIYFLIIIINMAPSSAKSLSSILKKKIEGKKTEEERDPIRKERKEHMERIEKACAGTTKSAKAYYETNRKINLLIVSVGVVFISSLVS